MVAITFQSLDWNSCAVALPIPLLAPVIKIVFFIFVSFKLENKVEANRKLANKTNSGCLYSFYGSLVLISSFRFVHLPKIVLD
jgi:hypothetical protein